MFFTNSRIELTVLEDIRERLQITWNDLEKTVHELNGNRWNRANGLIVTSQKPLMKEPLGMAKKT